MRRLNKRKQAKFINTFDFSTLYTKIPHDKLLYVLDSLIEFCFKGGTCAFIAVTDYEARWVQNHSQYKTVFNNSSIKAAVRYLMNNCYFTLGNHLFRQIIGIPMGSDPAPYFANLFLYFYESKWLKKIQRTDLRRARRFSNTFRFIDDLNAINDSGEFERSYLDIYPRELELGRENEDDHYASFLDLDISIVNGSFDVCLYDKRDKFPFSVVRMPYASSNMPSMMVYSSISAEILRIARAISNNNNKFLLSSKALLIRMRKQGAKLGKLEKVLLKTFGRHSQTFSHISANAREFVNNILY